MTASWLTLKNFKHDPGRDTIPYSYDLSQQVYLGIVPIDSSTHYLAFYTVGLHCQTPTQMPVCQAGRQFVPF